MGLSKIIYNITTFNFFPRRKRIQYKLTENYVIVQKNYDKHKKLAKEKAINRARSNHIRETGVKSGTKIFININGVRRISEKITFKKNRRLRYNVKSVEAESVRETIPKEKTISIVKFNKQQLEIQRLKAKIKKLEGSQSRRGKRR